MILAQNPEQIQNNQVNQNTSITKVYGFSKPVNPINNQETSSQNIIKEIVTEHEQKDLIFHWWHKIALMLITIHGLIGLWESVYFIIIEYSRLNNLLAIHQIETIEVNHLISRAIITFIVTSVNILFAIRLSKVKETTAHNIDLIVATFLIISTRFIQNFLFQLDLLNLVLRLIS